MVALNICFGFSNPLVISSENLCSVGSYIIYLMFNTWACMSEGQRDKDEGR